MSTYFGADFSKWNGINPDIKKQQFCILRAGYGKGNKDQQFLNYVKKCVKYKVPWGSYWFSYALDEEMAKNEAKYCISLVKKAVELYGVAPEYPIYFDFEADSESYFMKCKSRSVTRDEINKMTKAFCDYLEKKKYYAGVYCNQHYYNHIYELGGKYSIWLAVYRDFIDWSNRSSEIHMIQYTDKPYDKDVCRVDFPSIIRKNKLNGF